MIIVAWLAYLGVETMFKHFHPIHYTLIVQTYK
uniref:Uncharacterized protein n=1 Tax=Rhizophora mucronata TaxID=61149 RepID=A0A2P2JAM8_RHIMU